MDKQHDEYWHCIIGPAKRSDLQGGADFPLRRAVARSFKDVVGEWAETTWSGWGMSDYVREAVQYAGFHPQEIHALMAKRAKKEFGK